MQKELSLEAHEYLSSHRQTKLSERRHAAKVMRRLAKHLRANGYFQKGTFFSQDHGYVLRVIHVHKFTFGPCFRLHACIRVLDDSTGFLHLNGTDSSDRFVFDESDASLSACAERMLCFVKEAAEPWFESQTIGTLIRSDSILSEDARQGLQSSLRHGIDEGRAQLSRSLLGRVGTSQLGG
jgi:hypothetical protein